MRSLPAIILCCLLVLVSLSTASSLVDSRLEGGFVRRDNTVTSNGSNGPSSTDAPTSTQNPDGSGSATSTDSAASGTNGSNTNSATITDSASASGSGSRSNSGSSGSKTSRKTTSTVDPRLAPGGIEMVTPSPEAAPTYIKIGDHVTFAWNYTSLIVTPSAIDVVAYCSRNSQYYTILSNQSFASPANVTWDTNEYHTATVPLLTESYTLMVYDTADGPSAIPSAGHLGSASQFTFGMYIPQQYTPLGQFTCATCNGALSSFDRQALGFVIGMVTVTVLSFTWFANGFGVFS